MSFSILCRGDFFRLLLFSSNPTRNLIARPLKNGTISRCCCFYQTLPFSRGALRSRGRVKIRRDDVHIVSTNNYKKFPHLDRCGNQNVLKSIT